MDKTVVVIYLSFCAYTWLLVRDFLGSFHAAAQKTDNSHRRARFLSENGKIVLCHHLVKNYFTLPILFAFDFLFAYCLRFFFLKISLPSSEFFQFFSIFCVFSFLLSFVFPMSILAVESCLSRLRWPGTHSVYLQDILLKKYICRVK